MTLWVLLIKQTDLESYEQIPLGLLYSGYMEMGIKDGNWEKKKATMR